MKKSYLILIAVIIILFISGLFYANYGKKISFLDAKQYSPVEVPAQVECPGDLGCFADITEEVSQSGLTLQEAYEQALNECYNRIYYSREACEQSIITQVNACIQQECIASLEATSLPGECEVTKCKVYDGDEVCTYLGSEINTGTWTFGGGGCLTVEGQNVDPPSYECFAKDSTYKVSGSCDTLTSSDPSGGGGGETGWPDPPSGAGVSGELAGGMCPPGVAHMRCWWYKVSGSSGTTSSWANAENGALTDCNQNRQNKIGECQELLDSFTIQCTNMFAPAYPEATGCEISYYPPKTGGACKLQQCIVKSPEGRVSTYGYTNTGRRYLISSTTGNTLAPATTTFECTAEDGDIDYYATCSPSSSGGSGGSGDPIGNDPGTTPGGTGGSSGGVTPGGSTAGSTKSGGSN